MNDSDGLKQERASLDHRGPPWFMSMRYQLAFISLFGMACAFMQRINLSMAIVCMVNHTAVDLLTESQAYNSAAQYFPEESVEGKKQLVSSTWTLSPWNEPVNITQTQHKGDRCDSSWKHEVEEKEDGELVWTKEIQGLVLSGLYWGYTVVQVVIPLVLQKWGPRGVVAVGMLLMSSMTLLTPVLARWSPWAALTVRAAIGLTNGFVVPGLFAVWRTWAPPLERSRLISISFSGNMGSVALVFPLSALLCKSGLAGGWPSVFYVYGVFGVLWSLVWLYCVRDHPEEHPRIDPRERAYIQQSLRGSGKQKRDMKTPWLKIFTSLPYIGCVIAQVTYNWGFFLLLSTMPMYMFEVLHFDIKSNGVYSLIPYLTMFLSIIMASVVADMIIKRRILNVANTRKAFVVVCHVLPALLLVGLGYMECTQSQAAVALVSLAVGFSGFFMSAILPNFYDIAPAFAPQMMTMSNCISGIPGILAPYAVGEITKDKSREQWQIVFFITAGILIFGAVVYLILGQGQAQPWAVVKTIPEEKSSLSDCSDTPETKPSLSDTTSSRV